MRAARFHTHGGPEVLRVEDIEPPVPGPHDLLVRQRATTINRRDLWIRQGHPHPAYHAELPSVLGIDVCGDVVQVGDAVQGFAVGDRVTANPYMPCGSCPYCRRARPQYCPRFAVYQGTYAELLAVPAEIAIRVSPDLPDSLVACFPNNYPTAWEMLVRKAGMGPDDTVLVWAGTSGLGGAAIDIAGLAGARVITTAGTPGKREVLARRGLEVLDHHDPGLVDAVLETTGGLGPTIVFEHVGAATWERSLEMCAPGGTIVSAGATSGDEVRMDVTHMFVKQVRILGSRVADMDVALAAARQLDLGRYHPIIGAELPLEQIAEGHRMLEAGETAGKIVIRFDQPAASA